MSSTSSPSLTLSIHARRAERWAAVCVLLLAVAAPACFPLEPFALALLSLSCGGCAWLALRREGWLFDTDPVIRLSWRAEGDWELATRAGAHIACDLDHSSRVFAGVIWLCLRERNRRRARRFLITPRAVPEEGFRHLVVRLRLDGARSGDPNATPVGQGA